MRKWPVMTEFLHASEGLPGCWEYPGPRDRDGYAFYKENGNPSRAHQVSYRLANGAPSAGLVVCHSCDNPPCCNPAHLFAGTQKQNCEDARAKDRHSRGERNGLSKLTADQVRAIRHDQRRQIAIAADYGVRQATISNIKRRRLWGHVA